MSIIYVLIPIAVLLTAIGIYSFFWAVKTEQFDDLEKQGMSILFDDENDKVSQNKDNQVNLKNDELKDNELIAKEDIKSQVDKPSNDA